MKHFLSQKESKRDLESLKARITICAKEREKYTLKTGSNLFPINLDFKKGRGELNTLPYLSPFLFLPHPTFYSPFRLGEFTTMNSLPYQFVALISHLSSLISHLSSFHVFSRLEKMRKKRRKSENQIFFRVR